LGTPFPLAATVVVAIAAATIATVVTIAAAAEEQNQNDDPVHITATETVITTEITHTNTSTFFDAAFDAAHSMVFRKPQLVQRFSIVDHCRQLSIFSIRDFLEFCCKLCYIFLKYNRKK
jgi:hypothetical protein